MELCKAFNPNSSQVTVLGVNDETLGVIGNPGYVLMRLKTPYIATKVKYYTENHTFKAGVNFIRGNHLIWRWKPVGNYRVKLNQNQIDGIKTVWSRRFECKIFRKMRRF
jgi:hypothetical protein